jgi:signal transduction histidine kinase
VRRDAHRAIVEVADTGAGMEPEFIRHRLFRPFDTTKGDRGMGIGAYEVREFVRKCQGDVEVHSTPGQGTRFIISLPLARAVQTPVVVS